MTTIVPGVWYDGGMDGMESLTLPLAPTELPEKLRRFADPNAPVPAKTMAAKGLVPVRGGDLVTLLVQLGADPEPSVADAARKSLRNMPDEVLLPAVGGELHPAVLHGLATSLYENEGVLEQIVEHPNVHPGTVERVARHASERICEIIATNQARLLDAPAIVESLYKNKHARMSTIDRLVELCARNGVRLEGIPSFDAHVKAIQGQLIPEPTDEPLPTDTLFQEALAEDDGDATAVDIDKVDGSETVKEKNKPLSFRIRQMSISEKIRMAVVGDAAARSILLRDPNRMVSNAAINSPSMSEPEAAAIAHSKEVAEDILRIIANRKEWTRTYEVKRALTFNPKTPVGISMRFLSHMRPSDLKLLAKSRGVPNPLKTAAKQRLEKKMKGRS